MSQSAALAIAAAKVAMRVSAKANRAALSADYRAIASQRIATHGLDFLIQPPRDGAIIGGFMPIGDEISPLLLMAQLMGRGYRGALPVMRAKNAPLEFRCYTPGDALATGVWGIREPQSTALVVVPDVILCALLAFDDHGFRLGYGGGYYDRTIQSLRRLQPIITVGLAYDAQRVDAVPHLDYDEPVDWILTPSGARRSEPRHNQT